MYKIIYIIIIFIKKLKKNSYTGDIEAKVAELEKIQAMEENNMRLIEK